MGTINDFRQQWADDPNYEKGLMMYDNDKDLFVMAYFGCGDNLMQEDREQGFDDYVNIEVFGIEPPRDVNEEDGEMLLFNQEKADYYKDIEKFVHDVLEEFDMENDNINIIKIIHG